MQFLQQIGTGAGGGDAEGAPVLRMAALPKFDLSKGSQFKAKVVFQAFVDYDLPSFIGHRNITCAERMREIDMFRFHSPTESERQTVHVPAGRLSLHTSKDVLSLCGGLLGVRFETGELHRLNEIAHALASLYEQVSEIFTNFHLSLKKFRIEGDGDDTCESTKAVMEFHQLGDQYLRLVQELQTIVRAKQASIDRDAHFNPVDPDLDGVVGHKYPRWFVVLREKYEKEVLQVAAKQGNGKKPQFTLGKFAVFLGSREKERGFWPQEELEAMEELTDASRDFDSIFGSSGDTQTAHQSHADRDGGKYFSLRYFNFLRSVPELKSTVLDEEALQAMRQL